MRLLDDKVSGVELIALVLVGAIMLAPFSCWRLGEDMAKPMVVWMFGKADDFRPLRRVALQWEKEIGKTRLEIVHVPHGNVYMQKLLPALQANAAPDALFLHWSMVSQVAAKGALEPLDQLIERDQYDLDDLFPGSTSPYTIDQQLYAFPFRGSTMVLFYNKDMFDAAGIEYPNDEWTWDDYLRAAQKLTIVKDGFNVQVGCEPEETSSWIYSAGGDYASDDLSELYFSDPRTLQALQFFVDLRNKYKVTLRDVNPGSDRPMKIDEFENGLLAMKISGPWELERYQFIKQFRWGVALFPKGPAGRHTRYAGTGFGVWSGSSHKEQAWDFVKYMCSVETAQALASSATDVPARRSVAYSKEFLNPNYSWDMSVFVRALEPEYNTLHVFPRTPLWLEFRQLFGEHYDEVLLDGKDLKSSMELLERRIRGILRERGS